MAYRITVPIPLGLSQVGLTLSAKLFNTANVQVGSDITTGFTELGNGQYVWDYSVIPNNFRGWVRFYDGSDPVSFATITPQDVELINHLDADISSISGGGGSDPWSAPLPGSYPAGQAGSILGNLAGATIVGSLLPVITDVGDVEGLVKGNDYTFGSMIEFTDSGSWPNLSNAQISIDVFDSTLDMEVSQLDAPQKVALSLDGDITKDLELNRYEFVVYAKLTNQVDKVLAKGRFIFS